MLKLLLSEQRKIIKTEYLKRYFILILGILTIVMVLYGFSLTPTILIIKSEFKLLTEQLRIAKNPELNKDKVLLKNTLSELNHTVDILDVDRYKISSIINQITKNQIRGITISSINFDSKTETVVVNGATSNRESLVNFVSKLEAEEGFKSVALPFSSFTKNEDVSFSITVELVPLVTVSGKVSSKQK